MKEKGSLTPWPKSATGGEKVLVVDDDARVLDLLRITLTGRGFEVAVAANAEEALRRVRTEQPDLVVMNTKLPGTDGLKTMEEIRGITGLGKIPIVLISADGTSGAKLQGFRRGADDYVAKPFSPRELILRIRNILDRVEESKGLQRQIRLLESTVDRRDKAMEVARTELRGRLLRVGGVIGELQEMGGSRDMDDLLKRFTVIVGSYLEVDIAALFLRDDSSSNLVCRVIRGWNHDSREALVISVDSALAGEIGRATRLVSLESVQSLPEMSDESGRLLAAGIRYAYPIPVSGEIAGMICIGSIDGGRELDAVDVDLVLALARAAGEAVTRRRAQTVLEGSFLETTGLLIHSLERCYPGFEGHSERVSRHAVSLAEAHGLTAEEVNAIRLGSLLHDIGLVEIYDHLGTRTHPLPEEDRRRLLEAPLRAAEIIARAGLMDSVVDILKCHHEHWDGSGYPDGLGAESIPIGARMVAIANAFDAMTHDRPHRPAFSNDQAIATLLGEAGRVFDPDLVDLFVAQLAEETSPTP